MKTLIPIAKPLIGKNAKKYVLECLKMGWVSSKGEYVTAFEKAFANYLGVKCAISTTSGTAALHLALVALKIGKGDEVIVPTFTMIAPIFAVLYTGATPVLVDSQQDTWNMDVSLIEKKITKKTRAIITVHIYGHPVDMDPVLAIAKKYKLAVIEDAAESLGATYKKKKVGTLGIISCFSFYANKLITTGEGGMVTTNNKKLAERVKLLKDMAHSPKKRFLHTDVAFTYRMTNMQAALGLAQLEIIETLLTKKRWIAEVYTSLLRKNLGLQLPTEKPWAKNVYWMYSVLIKDTVLSKDLLRKKLYDLGIDTRDFFIPMHRQPVLRKLGLFKNEQYPVADDISKGGFYLPSGPKLTKKEINTACRILNNIYEKRV